MKQEERKVVYDEELQLEAYRFNGIMQKFPNHFHEYYVIGFVESGRRSLTCKNQNYIIDPGDLVIFNPGDNHSCCQVDDNALDWRCLNIKESTMRNAIREITGAEDLPVFTTTVIYRNELALRLRDLHKLIFKGHTDFRKEEIFYFLLEELVTEFTEPSVKQLDDVSSEIQQACDYMAEHYMEAISLDMLSGITGLKKYTLLRYFVKQKGVTPYQYLETIRVSEAKRCLEKGMSLTDAALESGFTDQSHFSRFFKNYIGLTPSQYQNIFL